MNINLEKNNWLKIIKDYTEKENQIGNRFLEDQQNIYEIKLKQIFKFIIYSQYVLKMININISNNILKNIRDKINFIKSDAQLEKFKESFNFNVQFYEDIENKVFPLQIIDKNKVNYLKFIKIYNNNFIDVINGEIIEFRNISFIQIQNKSKHPKVDKKIFNGLLWWISDNSIKKRLKNLEKDLKEEKISLRKSDTKFIPKEEVVKENKDSKNKEKINEKEENKILLENSKSLWESEINNFSIYNKGKPFDIRISFERKVLNEFNNQSIYCQNTKEALHLKNILILYNSYSVHSKNFLLNLAWKYKIQRANQVYVMMCLYFKYIKNIDTINTNFNLNKNEIIKLEEDKRIKKNSKVIYISNFYFPIKINEFKNKFSDLKNKLLPLIIDWKIQFFNIFNLKLLHETTLKGSLEEINPLNISHEYYLSLMKICNYIFINYEFNCFPNNYWLFENIFYQKTNNATNNDLFFNEVKAKVSFKFNDKLYEFEKLISLNSFKKLDYNTYIFENKNSDFCFINISLNKFNNYKTNTNLKKFKPLSKSINKKYFDQLLKKFNIYILNKVDIAKIYNRKYHIFNIYYNYLSNKIRLENNFLSTKFLNDFSVNIEYKFLNALKKFSENINFKSSNSLRANLLLIIKNINFENKIKILNRLYNIKNFDKLIQEIEGNKINLFFCADKFQIQKNLYNSMLIALNTLVKSLGKNIFILNKILKYIAYSLSIQIFDFSNNINNKFSLDLISYYIIICNFYLTLYKDDENYLKNIEIEFQMLKKTISSDFPMIFNNIHYKNSSLESIFYRSFTTNFLNFMNFQNFTIFNDILMCLYYYLREDKIFYFSFFKTKIIEVIINDYYEVFIKIKHPIEFNNFFFNIFSNNLNFNLILTKAIFFFNHSYQSNDLIKENLLKHSKSINIEKIKKFYNELIKNYSNVIIKNDLMKIILKLKKTIYFEQIEVLLFKVTEYFKFKNKKLDVDINKLNNKEPSLKHSLDSLIKYNKFIERPEKNMFDKFFDYTPKLISQKKNIIELKIKNFNNEYIILRNLKFTYDLVIKNNMNDIIYDAKNFNENINNIESILWDNNDITYLEFNIKCITENKEKNYLFKGYFYTNSVLPNFRDSHIILLYNLNSNFNIYLYIEVLFSIPGYESISFKIKDNLQKINLFNNFNVSFIYNVPEILAQNSIIHSTEFKEFKNYLILKSTDDEDIIKKFQNKNLNKIDMDILNIIIEYFQEGYFIISIIELILILLIFSDFRIDNQENNKKKFNVEKHGFKKKILLIFKILLFFENLHIKSDKPLYISLDSIKYFYSIILSYYHLNFERNMIFNHVESFYLWNSNFIKDAKIIEIEDGKEILILNIKNIMENILFNNHRIYGKKVLYLNKNFVLLLKIWIKDQNIVKNKYILKIKCYTNLKNEIFSKSFSEILGNEFFINFEKNGIFSFEEFFRIINQDFWITSIFKQNINFNNETEINEKNHHYFLKLFNTIDFYVRKENKNDKLYKKDSAYNKFLINGVPVNTPHFVDKFNNIFIN